MNRKVFVTGGSGLIARYIVNRFSQDKNYLLYAVVSENRINFAEALYKPFKNVKVITAESLFDDEVKREQLKNSFVIHTAFTRKNDGKEIVRSLQYTYRVFELCKIYSVAGVLNISSRSVYKDPDAGTLNDEDSELCAKGLISAAKYASELLLLSFFANHTTGGRGIKYSNLRVSSVNELKTDNNMTRPLNVFVDCIIKGENIKVYGGSQIMSYIDPRDAAEAVYLMCSSGNKSWKDTYNVGSGCTYTIQELAEKVISIGAELGYAEVNIEVIMKDDFQRAGLNIERIREDFGFEPKITIDEMIRSLFEMKRGRV